MIFAVRNEGQRVHERHGPVIVLEMNYSADRLSMFNELPAIQQFQMMCALIRGKQVSGTFQRPAGLFGQFSGNGDSFMGFALV